MTRFTKADVRVLQAEIDQALRAVGDRHGITIKLDPQSVRYSFESVVFKGEAVPNGVADAQVREFNYWCTQFGLRPEHYGAHFVYARKAYTLVGFNPQADKYPILGETPRGARYKLPLEAVRELLDPEQLDRLSPLFARRGLMAINSGIDAASELPSRPF